jgi:hypothetical protein
VEVSVYRHHHWVDSQGDQEIADRQTASLIGVVVILLLLIGSLFLAQQLRSTSWMEDCEISGRTDCELLLSVAH